MYIYYEKIDQPGRNMLQINLTKLNFSHINNLILPILQQCSLLCLGNNTKVCIYFLQFILSLQSIPLSYYVENENCTSLCCLPGTVYVMYVC